MSISDAAKDCGVSKSTIYRYIKSGQVKVTDTGSGRRVDMREVVLAVSRSKSRQKNGHTESIQPDGVVQAPDGRFAVAVEPSAEPFQDQNEDHPDPVPPAEQPETAEELPLSNRTFAQTACRRADETGPSMFQADESEASNDSHAHEQDLWSGTELDELDGLCGDNDSCVESAQWRHLQNSYKELHAAYQEATIKNHYYELEVERLRKEVVVLKRRSEISFSNVLQSAVELMMTNVTSFSDRILMPCWHFVQAYGFVAIVLLFIVAGLSWNFAVDPLFNASYGLGMLLVFILSLNLAVKKIQQKYRNAVKENKHR